MELFYEKLPSIVVQIFSEFRFIVLELSENKLQCNSIRFDAIECNRYDKTYRPKRSIGESFDHSNAQLYYSKNRYDEFVSETLAGITFNKWSEKQTSKRGRARQNDVTCALNG